MVATGHYDLAIVGGGINGCALARAAARSGFRTVLLEKRDFGSGTTSRSTRLIHGGLRYLERFQFSLVRESLRDREVLLREFPGQVAPQAFLLPVYAGDSRPPWYLALGMAVYEGLSAGGRLPHHRLVSAREALVIAPGLNPRGLRGGFAYYDCQAAYPERLALEMALQAEENGAEVCNHARVTGFLMDGPRVLGVRFEREGAAGELSAGLVVNAAGAWVDRVLGLLDPFRARPLLALVNGAHIVIRAFPGAPRHAVYREARSDGRPFFIVPWRGLYLIGTTETRFAGSPDSAIPLAEEILYLLAETNDLCPGAAVGPQSILYSYSGSRPLLRAPAGDLNRATRGYAVVDHERDDRILGLITMAGGKLTTAPSLAARTLRQARRKLRLPASRAGAISAIPRLDGVPPRVASMYGPRAPALLRFLESAPELARPLARGCEVTRGEVLFAVQREKARTLGDILLRRTGLAHDPDYEPRWAEAAAAICRSALGWSAAREDAELSAYETELRATLRRG